MKRFFYVLFFITVGFSFVSCATTMVFSKYATPKTLEKNQNSTIDRLEFIGFKTDDSFLSKNTGEHADFLSLDGTNYFFPSELELWKTFKTNSCIKDLGSALQKSNIAYNKSYSYFNTYTKTDLEQYESDHRFVSFVEVETNLLNGKITDSILYTCIGSLGVGASLIPIGIPFMIVDSDGQTGLKGLGGTMLGFGIGASLLGGVLAFVPCKTILRYNGLYNIVVFDTQNKEIVYKDSVSIRTEDVFKGSYFNEETKKMHVHNYYATLVYNRILEKYAEVIQFLEEYE